MKTFPHHYTAIVNGYVDGDVELRAGRLPVLLSAPPEEFDGPGDRWSPETLLVAAVADCFVLTFRAVARAMELRWTVLHCGVVGIVDRVDHVPQFTAFHIRARLGVSAETNEQLAKRAVEKAERGCLIANSLKPPVQLETTIEGLEPAQMV